MIHKRSTALERSVKYFTEGLKHLLFQGLVKMTYTIEPDLDCLQVINRILAGKDVSRVGSITHNTIFFVRGERIQIALKAGHHRHASETPLNGVSLAGR